MPLKKLIKRAARKSGSIVGRTLRSPIGKVAGRAFGPLGIATAAYSLLSPSQKSGLPALPGIPGFNGSMMPMGNTGGTGIMPKGPGGRMQMPWSDPSVAEYLKAFALDDQYIKTAMRAPRGYVIVRDANGRPYPLLKKIAQHFKLWKPAKKPPISVGDFQALKTADRTAKKVKRIMSMVSRVDKNVGKGGKVKIPKRK